MFAIYIAISLSADITEILFIYGISREQDCEHILCQWIGKRNTIVEGDRNTGLH